MRLKSAAIRGDAYAHLTWMPGASDTLSLGWDLIFTDRAGGEMVRMVVDASTGATLSKQSLTQYLVTRAQPMPRANRAVAVALSPRERVDERPYRSRGEGFVASAMRAAVSNPGASVTLNVYTRESPTPFLPAWPTSQTGQPPLASRQLLTLNSINPAASPNGWIDSNLDTRGNNVDAHTDVNSDDIPDLPRPQAAGTNPAVFDFPIDFNQVPGAYKSASVVQLFYWCNFMHDKLYALGFTEAAGNFQNDNFGRGGLGGDALQADAQDGGGTENANFNTPPDGQSPRMQLYLFPNAPPAGRDPSFDATVVLHEYTHGLSNRLVGGGVGISALQPSGMGEGWSDFYALSMVSNPADDVNGTYPVGAYVMFGDVVDNYYRGLRRYPYAREPDPAVTSASINPLTFAAIQTNYEVHKQGEVWCSALWEARANLIDKYAGTATDANQLMLQLVTDGMKLSPANPTFLQARDAILQADTVDNAGANLNELWRGFAKRGMGFSAQAGSSDSIAGVVEAFDLPGSPSVSIIANQSGVFTFTLSAAQTTDITVNFTVSGTAVAGADYTSIGTSINIPANQASATLMVTPLPASAQKPNTTVVVSLATGANYAVGAPSSDTVTLQGNSTPVNHPPVFTSQAAAEPQPARVGDILTFNAAANDADGDALTYTWDFGDGTNGQGASAMKIYSAQGNYSVTVTVSDGKATASQSFSVEIDPALQKLFADKVLKKFNFHAVNKDSLWGRRRIAAGHRLQSNRLPDHCYDRRIHPYFLSECQWKRRRQGLHIQLNGPPRERGVYQSHRKIFVEA